MRSLLRAEWLRQRRRPDVWILPLAAIAFGAFAWWTGLTSAEEVLRSQQFPGDPLPPDFAEQLIATHDPFLFPASFHVIATSGFLAFIAAIHFGSAWTGSEFVRGTVRNIFLSSPGRRGFFGARLLALAAVLWLVVVGFALLAFLLPLIRGVQGSGDPPVSSAGGLLAYGAAVWFVLWFIALAATTVATFVRNGGVALLIVFIFAVIDLIVGNLTIWRDTGLLAWLPQLLPVGRLVRFMDDASIATGFSQADIQADQTRAAITVPPLVGTAIVAAWTALLLVALFVRVRRMDIME